ncbi:hypothetical protein [Brevundimonas sp. UBA2416]|nr:hypothetical protein [Brevundimonas sp. UBA2416]
MHRPVDPEARPETVALLDRLRGETGDAYAQWRDPFHAQRRLL